MQLIRYIAILIGVILTSFYIFPIGVGVANTKMIMAAIGLVIFIFREAFADDHGVNKYIVILIMLALGVSFVCWFAIEYNHTNDTTYVSYIVSMMVWLFGAYALIWYLQRIHESLTVLNVGCYLAAVGAIQGILAIWMNNDAGLVDYFIRLHLLNAGDVEYARQGDRLFGLGCAYDPGGIRLAAILVIMGCLLNEAIKKFHTVWKFLYIAAFLCITVFGNMISRTTSVGFLIALAYIFFKSGLWKFSLQDGYANTLKWFGSILVLGVMVTAFYYNSNEKFRENFRFGFEGFVSLVEKGEWDVKSNDSLATMYRFPTSTKTWLIGDGYIDTTDKDPFYVGERYSGYYMATDVGYLRFIYYGGLPMALAFLAFIGWCAVTCQHYFPKYWAMFWLLFLLQLGVWFKVATDIFCIFAIFIALGIVVEAIKSRDA